MALTLMNQRTGDSVATDVELAATRQSRRRGLLGREGLDEACAMLPGAVHRGPTVGMRFTIDVASSWTVRAMQSRSSATCGPGASRSPAARAVVEMPAGSLRRGDVMPGDRFVSARRFPSVLKQEVRMVTFLLFATMIGIGAGFVVVRRKAEAGATAATHALDRGAQRPGSFGTRG
jgi:uncharacterized membrane protein (UPF0127 family)